MSTLNSALTALAAVEVTGITGYALAQTPEALSAAQLPALIIVPELGGTWPGLEASGFSAADGKLTAQIAHLLLLAPTASGGGARAHFPALVTAIDAYIAALNADPTLGGALPLPLRFRVTAGVTRWGGVDYHAATFLHTWTLLV